MANQNQGMTIAVIVFVILTVISMTVAVLFVKESSEMTKRKDAAEESARQANRLAEETGAELNEIKRIVSAQPTSDQVLDAAGTRKKFEEDLGKYGARLKLIASEASVPQTYSQMLESALAALSQRNTALEAAKVQVATVNAQKTELEATFQGQVNQYKEQTEAALKEKADVQAKMAAVEMQLQEAQLAITDAIKKKDDELQVTRAEMQKQIDDLSQQVVTLQGTNNKLQEYIDSTRETAFAATYDGTIRRVNPTTRTVWVNLGSYDNLPKHVSFSVQAQGVPAGSSVPPKAKIEITNILGDHLAEARIVEDDLRDPILVGDNVVTTLWNPGQKTRFAFAGKIDLDNNGSDDMDQVRALVARAGGQIDAEIINGEVRGALTLDTRYLVLGAVPADKAGGDAYKKMLQEATDLGIQRVPMSVFFDQVGYKREARTVQFGGGASGTQGAMDVPDGGQRVSTGRVSNVFAPRRPAGAASAY